MKILIGVDESSYSNAALQFVRGLPLPADTRVIIASAVQVPIPVFTEAYVPAPGPVDQLLEIRTKVHQDLVSQAERQLRAGGLQVEGRVLHGDPREMIVQTAIDERVDLVVVGSHGRSGITKLLMGSVATHVVTHAPCSVLVVKTQGRVV
jgi:nucleotide-binding universal stress UspA family protein